MYFNASILYLKNNNIRLRSMNYINYEIANTYIKISIACMNSYIVHKSRAAGTFYLTETGENIGIGFHWQVITVNMIHTCVYTMCLSGLLQTLPTNVPVHACSSIVSNKYCKTSLGWDYEKQCRANTIDRSDHCSVNWIILQYTSLHIWCHNIWLWYKSYNNS